MTIKELRDKYSLSQSALAKAIGVSASTIGAIEGGRMKVSPKIADAVKATYGEVLEDDPKAENKSKVEKKAEKVEKKAGETKAKAKTAKAKAETKAATVAKKTEKVEAKAEGVKTKAKEKAADVAVKAEKV